MGRGIPDWRGGSSSAGKALGRDRLMLGLPISIILITKSPRGVPELEAFRDRPPTVIQASRPVLREVDDHTQPYRGATTRS